MPEDVEMYGKRKIQVYHGEVPKTLKRYMRTFQWESFLDIGCGDGVLIHSLNQIGLFREKRCYGVDLSETRVKRTMDISPNALCTVDDACDIKTIKNSSIDIAVSMGVIEHVDSDEKAIKEISRVLRPGGIAYIETVFKKPWAWYFYKYDGNRVLEPNHIREYTSDDELFPLLRKYGLEIIESRKYFFWFSLLDVFGHKTKLIKDTSKGILSKLRVLKVPIIGYYNWEIVCKKEF